jgi:D-alanyl-D-alanine dipeptidase
MLGIGAAAGECPTPLSNALRLVLVTAPGMHQSQAQLRRFTRVSQTEAWTQEGEAEPTVLGAAGLAWGYTFDHLRQGSEPLKVEGDRRTPAGIFRLGPSFGFGPAPFPGHIVLKADESLCIDDPRSKLYNTIRARAEVDAGTSAEEMWRIPFYRAGLIVQYPTNRRRQRGSCIFIHVWKSRAHGTAGCVALPEARVKLLQQFSQGGAALAILPDNALQRLSGCLPGVANRAGE